MAKIKANVKGPIVGGDIAWVYNWLGMSCTSAAGFKQELAKAQDGDTVIVEINSPGGYVNEAAEFYEAIRSFDGEIECCVVGQAASCASFIACAAKSSISPMGYLFLHNCSSSCSGNQHDMRQTMETLASIDENIMGAYKAKTGMSDEQIYELMEQNTTISAQRAVDLGFIDEITPESGVAAFNIGEHTTGIAAAAPGLIDFGAIDFEKVAELRDAYMQTHDFAGGGTDMKNEIKDVRDELEDETVEPEAVEDEPAQADEQEEAEAAEECAEEDAEPEAEPESEPVEDRYEAGVLAERSRIEGIMAISDSIDSEMVLDALFTHPIDAQQLAFDALSAKRAKVGNYMEHARADAKASKSSEVAPAVADSTEVSSAQQEIDSMVAKMTEKITNK